jgi:hypothetical protein
MSYAGPVSRGKRAATVEPLHREGLSRPWLEARRRPLGAPVRGVDSSPPVVFAAGVFLGVILGASTALLFTPQSGADTRHAIAREGRRLGRRGRDAWEDLGDELRNAARRSRRAMKRRRDARRDARHERRQRD